MKRKLAIAALALSMVVSNVAPYATMTVHAEESDEIGDILDDVFGGNKPDNSQGTGTTGGGTDEIDWDNMNKPQNSNDGGSGSDDGGSSDSGNTDNSGSGNEGGNSGSENTGGGDEDNEIGDILDDIFGGSKPDNSGGTGTTGGGTDNIDWDNMNKPQNGGSDNSGSGNTGNSGNSGSNNGGSSNTGSNAGSSTTVTDPDTGKTTTTTVNADGSTTVVTTDPATGETTTVTAPPAASSIAVDVTDPAILAIMPEAMIVTSHTSGIPFVHALDATKTSYNVWSDGYLVDAFYIVDAAGTPVVMQAVDILTGADGKVYVNVTIDPAVAGASVFAAEEQRVAFAKHYGIDGVMINGMLADTFVALYE